MRRPTVIIAENEPALAEWLATQLRRHWPELDIVGIAADGDEAMALLDTYEPDIAFLGIRLPGKSGLEIAADNTRECHVVFVTAYNRYAIAAFESGAVDYLLKPVAEGRLLRTIDRLKHRIGQAPANVAAVIGPLAGPRDDYLEWVQAGHGEDIEFIPVDSVAAFIATDKLTICHASGREHLLRASLKELESRLDPRRFWRVHRNAIIRVASIEKIRRDVLLGLVVHLRGLERGVAVSRANAGRFRAM